MTIAALILGIMAIGCNMVSVYYMWRTNRALRFIQQIRKDRTTLQTHHVPIHPERRNERD